MMLKATGIHINRYSSFTIFAGFWFEIDFFCFS